MFRNSNPVFNNIEKQSNAGQFAVDVDTNVKTASWTGITLKTLLLVFITLAVGIVSKWLPFEVLIAGIIVGTIGSFFIVFFAMRKPESAMVLSIIYAVAQGLMYGSITWVVEFLLPGIGIMAIGGTLLVVMTMTVLYSIGAVRATPFLAKFVMGSLIAIMLASLAMWIITLVNPNYLIVSPGVGIAISGFFVIIGALMLILDFDRAKMLVETNAPTNMEWQAGLGILITTVWIYINILKMLLYVAARKE